MSAPDLGRIRLVASQLDQSAILILERSAQVFDPHWRQLLETIADQNTAMSTAIRRALGGAS